MDKVNIGVIGGGYVSQYAYLRNLAHVDGCRLVALAEHRPELRRRVAERFGIEHAYASHTDLLAHPDLDAVVIVIQRSSTAPVLADPEAEGSACP